MLLFATQSPWERVGKSTSKFRGDIEPSMIQDDENIYILNHKASYSTLQCAQMPFLHHHLVLDVSNKLLRFV